jgi:hypothetical protein
MLRKEATSVSLKGEFVNLAERACLTALCRRFSISRKTGYKGFGRYPSILPPIEYGPQDAVRKVQGKGEISFHNREWRVGHAFRGYPVGMLPTNLDGFFDVYFCHQKIASPADGRRAAGRGLRPRGPDVSCREGAN